MAFPAGSFPRPTDVADKFVSVESVAFTHGGTDMDLTDPTNGLGPCALELYCTTSGNIVAVLMGDADAPTYASPVAQTYPVVAGQVLKGAFVLISSTSTANCIARR